ncbi:MAG TPA: ComF family protein [bacterium]|nr:ComF family protein [bacterium]
MAPKKLRLLLLFHHIIEMVFPEKCIGCGRNIHIEKYCFCNDCLAHLVPASQSSNHIFSLTVYNDPVQKAIHTFKYERKKWLGKIFAQWMHDFLVAHPDIEFDFIIPVPLHPIREFHRSFNQSWLIAYHLGKLRKKPAMSNVLIKTRNNKSQTGLDSIERKQNVKAAYRVKKPSLVKNSSILVIDDVYTTGATAEEIYRTLKNSGAKTVYILTIAKA